MLGSALVLKPTAEWCITWPMHLKQAPQAYFCSLALGLNVFFFVLTLQLQCEMSCADLPADWTNLLQRSYLVNFSLFNFFFLGIPFLLPRWLNYCLSPETYPWGNFFFLQTQWSGEGNYPCSLPFFCFGDSVGSIFFVGPSSCTVLLDPKRENCVRAFVGLDDSWLLQDTLHVDMLWMLSC